MPHFIEFGLSNLLTVMPLQSCIRVSEKSSFVGCLEDDHQVASAAEGKAPLLLLAEQWPVRSTDMKRGSLWNISCR